MRTAFYIVILLLSSQLAQAQQSKKIQLEVTTVTYEVTGKSSDGIKMFPKTIELERNEEVVVMLGK